MKAKLIVLARYLAGVAIFSAAHAVFSYLGDAVHLAGIVSPAVALVITTIAAWADHSIEARSGNALFGVVKGV